MATSHLIQSIPRILSINTASRNQFKVRPFFRKKTVNTVQVFLLKSELPIFWQTTVFGVGGEV